MSTAIDGATVLVTGANGGLGVEFVQQALNRGAKKVYATARDPRGWNDGRIVPLPLDVTDSDSINAAAAAASDTTVVVNNAAIAILPDRLLHLPMARSDGRSTPTSLAHLTWHAPLHRSSAGTEAAHSCTSTPC